MAKKTGLCVGILSGDRILLQGPAEKDGGFKQKILHLTGVTAPKIDTATGNDDRYGFAAREYLRTRLVGKNVQFVVEKKINETELGYVIYEGKDITIDLLKNGYVKMRGEKIACDNVNEYLDAEEQAKMGERGVWAEEDDHPDEAFRHINKKITDEKFLADNKEKKLRAIVEEIHPSKAVLYFQESGVLTTLNFSEVQVVVLKEEINGESKNNVRAIRSVLESNFLQKEVNVVLKAYTDGLQGYLVSQSGDDIRKILLENGFAKLGKDAMTNATPKQFMELKEVAHLALEGKKGLWKQQNFVQSQKLNSKSYDALVSEVHSGDCITVYNIGKKQFVRVFFPNVRAPGKDQPLCFEAKQALRKKFIGQLVQVEVEFSKKVTIKKEEGDAGELVDRILASVFENGLNLAAYLLEQGFLNIQPPRVEEDCTKYFQILAEAEQKGKTNKRGLHSSNASKTKIPSFNDLSGGKGKKIDPLKTSSVFMFLKDEHHLSGVIDLVLNGSRFKLRFNQQNVMVICVLDGVRCLPNEGEYKKASEAALDFSKLKATQRDVEVVLKRIDKKGIFHVSLSISKKDFAVTLLENGHAFCMNDKNAFYKQTETEAKKKKEGLWKENLNLNALIEGGNDKIFQKCDLLREGVIIEVASGNEFYLEPLNCKRVQVPQKPEQAAVVKVGEIYCAQFTDGVYYRARILKELNNGNCSVHYIDFGNYDTVKKSSIGNLSEQLKAAKSPLIRLSLFGVDDITEEGANIIRDYLDATVTVELKEIFEDKIVEYRGIVREKDRCINTEVLQLGEGKCSCEWKEWIEAEEKAIRMREGIWAKE